MSVEHRTECPEVTWTTFWNALGGALSLYLGICLVTFFELFEFVVKTAAAILFGVGNRSSSTSTHPKK